MSCLDVDNFYGLPKLRNLAASLDCNKRCGKKCVFLFEILKNS